MERMAARLVKGLLVLVLAVGASVLPGVSLGEAQADDTLFCQRHPSDPSCYPGDPPFCQLHPYDVTCTGGTCDIYTQYCPPVANEAWGGGSSQSYVFWVIPRNPSNQFPTTTCNSPIAQRKAYALSELDGYYHRLHLNDWYISPADYIEIIFPDGLSRSYKYFAEGIDDYSDGTFGKLVDEAPCGAPSGQAPFY